MSEGTATPSFHRNTLSLPSYKGLVVKEAVIIIILETSEDATKSPQWPQK